MDLFKSDEELQHELKGIETKLEEKRNKVISKMYVESTSTYCYPVSEEHDAKEINELSPDEFEVVKNREVILSQLKARHKEWLEKEEVVRLLNQVKNLEKRAEDLRDKLRETIDYAMI